MPAMACSLRFWVSIYSDSLALPNGKLSMSTSSAFVVQASQGVGKVWWREPYVWLVIGGPLVVVVAAVWTGVIAFTNPDPVLDPRNIGQAEFMVQSKKAQYAKDNLVNMQPAMVGRNHAASPLPLEPVGTK